MRRLYFLKPKPQKNQKVSQLYQRQQLQVAGQERKFFYFVIIIFSIIQIVTGTISHVQNPLLNTETKLVRILLRILFYLSFNLLVILLFRLKQKKKVTESQLMETIIALLVGVACLVGCIFQLIDQDQMSLIDPQKLQLDVYILGSDSLLWLLLLLSFIKQTMNIAIYIIFVVAGYVILFFKQQDWVMGTKTLLQGIIVIVLLFHLGKKRLESFLETWKLRAAGVLYKNVLNSLPESIMVITESGKVEFRNDYLVKMFEYDIKDGFQGFCSAFSDLKLRDCIEETKFKLFSITNSFTEKFSVKRKGKDVGPITEGVFKTKAAGIHTLGDLIQFFKENVEIWAHVSNHTLVFDTKYSYGTQKELSIEIKAFIILDDQEVQLALIFRDTTDRDRIVTLESENEVYKNNIIASFSHELRTPLNSNMGLLEQGMDRSDLAPEIKETLLEPALVSAKLLLNLINSILDYSQLLNRNFELNIQPFPIRQTIGKCLYLFEKQIIAKGLDLEVNVQADDETVFYTDHERLSQILANLLSNALKFTFQGSVKIEFIEEASGGCRLSVLDTGIGMDEEVQEKLRKNMVAKKVIEPKISSESAGIGLGLFMASIFCSFISSETSPGLQFKSKKNQGSEFYFILKDFCPPTEPSRELVTRRRPEVVKTFKTCVSLFSEAEDNHAGRSVVSNYRTQIFKNKLLETELLTKISEHNSNENPVILIDDEIFNLLILENYCKTVGLKTERAFNGKEAIEKIRKMYKEGSKVSIILVDVNMPIMDGYETTLALREMIKKKEIDDLIIVGVTAYVSRDKIDKCYLYGMNEVVNKPLSQTDFVRIMKKYDII